MQAVAVPRPWHLEGRWGSRTHTVDANHMGLPIVSVSHLKEVTETSSALQELLRVEGVEVRENQPFCTSKRAKEGEVFDATIHAERHIRPSKRPRIQLTPSSSQVQLTAQVFPPSTDSQISYGNSFTYAELFCGIGGFGVALEALGGRCLMVSEIDETCRQVYEANFPLTPRDKIYGDIYQVQESNLPPPGTLDLLV